MTTGPLLFLAKTVIFSTGPSFSPSASRSASSSSPNVSLFWQQQYNELRHLQSEQACTFGCGLKTRAFFVLKIGKQLTTWGIDLNNDPLRPERVFRWHS